ncbi:MAG: sugar-binding domain-containing protein, partial [Saprospiraceae bacterium]
MPTKTQLSMPSAAERVRYLEDPTVFSIGQERPHAHFTPYSSQDSFLKNENSTRVQVLDGDWNFHWSPNPASRPIEFFRADFDSNNWSKIPVPSNWQLQGHGIPIYVNDRYPFHKNPPYIPQDDNPVGSYLHTFSIAENWSEMEIFLTFGAVKGAAHFWLNGEYLGYNQDSKTPVEFNISRHLQAGENSLAVEITRWHDGSYLECQDFWRLSGIERSVFLTARPKTYVRDFFVHAGLDENYKNGEFSIELEVVKSKLKEAVSIELQLIDNQNDNVFIKKLERSGKRHPSEGDFQELIYAISFPNVQHWTAETPNLYQLILSTFNKNDELLEVT